MASREGQGSGTEGIKGQGAGASDRSPTVTQHRPLSREISSGSVAQAQASSSSSQQPPPPPAVAEHPTCDTCRSRKVRCVPLAGTELVEAEREALADRCRGCFKRKEECSYDYVHKKPGRPFGSSTKRKRGASPSFSREGEGEGEGEDSRAGHGGPSIGAHGFTGTPSPALPFSYHLSPRNHTSGSSPYEPYPHHSASGHSSGHSFAYGTPAEPAHAQLRLHDDLGDSDAGTGDRAHVGPTHGPATGTIFGSARSVLGYGDLMAGMNIPLGGLPDGGMAAFMGGGSASVSGVTAGGGMGGYGAPGLVGGYGGSAAVGGGGGGAGMTTSPFDIGPQLSPRTEALFSGGLSSSTSSSAAGLATRPRTSASDIASQRYSAGDLGAGHYEPHRTASMDSADTEPLRRSSGQAAWPASRPPPPSVPRTSVPGGGGTSHSGGTGPALRPQANVNPIPQIESVASYSDVMFFVSLHMRYNHVLVPLVHKPTFAQDVLMRRDQKDEVFRGLLCSIVSYTICQTPFSFMSPQYTRAELEKILRRCQKTSRAVQLRWHMLPNLVLVASTQLDIKTSLAATQLESASVLMSEARRMVYSLGLHRETPKDGLSFIELEICRRLFWEIYQNDKTNVMNGLTPISLNDFEGTPPLPLEVDDEYLTTTGHAPQPPSTASYMSGFVAGLRLFQVLGQCQLRQRILHACPEAGTSKDVLYAWIEDAQHRVRALLEALPEELQADIRVRRDGPGGSMAAAAKHAPAPAGNNGTDGHERETTFGIQQANIHITALCVEFALLDFKVHLRPQEDTKSERESMARKAHHLLSSIPIEYLASNGESMRGKVLRIVLDLLAMSSEPGNIGEGVWDWWNMYSSVQFFQIIPDVTTSENASRRTSPS